MSKRLYYTAQAGLPVDALSQMVESLLALTPSTTGDALHVHWGACDADCDILLLPSDLISAANALLERLGLLLLDGDYAVIGSPIAHSLSPFLHARVFKTLGVSARYQAAHVTTKTLPAFLRHARRYLHGFNVTHPLKEAILPLLDDVSADARLAGAVNTVVVTPDGRLQSHNTDMRGLDDALALQGYAFRGTNVLVLGAGGAAKSACIQAAKAGARALTVLARRPAQAADLCDRLTGFPGVALTAGDLMPRDIALHAAKADLLLQCTPLGMSGIDMDFDRLDFLDALPRHALVFDMIYRPAVTRLLSGAKARGLTTQNGLDMLIAQAIRADALFLGKPLTLPALHRQVRDALVSQLDA